MNHNTRRPIGAAGLRIARRLTRAQGGQPPLGDGPEFAARTIHYEIAERTQAITCGGIGAVHQLADKVGLVKALDTRLPILKRRRPYSESDHILNIVYNTMCGGLVLDDIEIRRNDAAFLDALGARTIPDPTTAAVRIHVFRLIHVPLMTTSPRLCILASNASGQVRLESRPELRSPRSRGLARSARMAGLREEPA